MDPKVLEVLTRITSRCELSAAQQENLKLLQDPKTKTIVTGQQVGLCGGPLLTLYKALGCVLYAKEFSIQNKLACVPIFWLQTEDHDFAEVATTHFTAAGGADVTLSAKDASASGERTPLHYRVLAGEVESTAREFLAAAPNGSWLCDLLARIFKPGQSWELAFQNFMHALLKDTGILFFHTREPEIATICAPIYKIAIEQHEQITSVLKNTLERDKLNQQVHIRAGSPLAFFQPLSINGERVRLQARDDQFDFISTSGSIAKNELLSLLQAQPLRFSASALLRPIIQQRLLQPQQYVAGAAEQAYFKQITDLFKYFELSAPQVVPRPAARLIDKKFASWLTQYQIELSALAGSNDEFTTTLAQKSGLANPDAIKATIDSKLTELFNQLEKSYVPIDATLHGAIERVRARVTPSFDGLHERLLAALATRDQVRVERLGRIRGAVFPGGIEQERHFSALSYLARSGLQFVEQVKTNLKLFKTEPVTIELD